MDITLPIQEHIYVKNIKRIQELTLQANKDILDIEANHRKDVSLIELENFKTSIYNIEREASAIYSDADADQPLDDIRLRTRIYDTRNLIHKIYIMKNHRLAEMTSPIQNPLQEHVYGECIKRIQELIQQANTEILDIETNHSKNIFSTELKNFKLSLCQIERETSAIYSDLCTWKASHTRPPAGSSEEHKLIWRPSTPPLTRAQNLTKTETPRELIHPLWKP